ncbi:MAG: hypothetical protein U1E42_04500 [Rhodospirillales bacterium]
MTRALWLPLCFGIALLMIGIPSWRMSYNQDPFTNMALWPGAILLAVLPAVLVIAEAATVRRIFLVMSLCVPLVDIAIILRDTAIDPTNHNLWPLELIFSGIIGGGIVLPGLLIGVLVRAVMRRG